MKTSKLREMTKPELDGLLLELAREQFSLRMQKATGQLSKYDRLRGIRREIARIYTVNTEKENTQ